MKTTMDGANSDDIVREPLDSARKRLTDILPPQSAKLVQSLQYVELAMQYSSVDGRDADVMKGAKNALRALNSIENRQALPPVVSTCVSRAIIEILKAVRAMEAQQARRDSQVHTDSYTGADRRSEGAAPYPRHLPRRRNDDDTVDGLRCLDEALLGPI